VKKTSLLIIIFIIYSFNIALPQAPIIVWQNTIGGDNEDELNSIQQTTDGGYILGGNSLSEISGDKTEASQGFSDYWVIKLDATGQTIEWQNTIGGQDYDKLNSIQQTTDGGYILGGYSSSGISGDKTEASKGSNDYWVVKLDATGQTIEWQNTIGGNVHDELTTIQQTADGGYILGGYSQSGISGDKTELNQGSWDYWVVKLDATGQTIEWQNTIGGSNRDELNSIQQTADGGYILGGYSESGADGDKNEANQGDKDYWVIKLDATGQTIEWQNTLGGSDKEFLYSIQQTTDGGYILGGNSLSEISGDKTEASQGFSDYWVIKLDATGQAIEWQNTLGGSGYDILNSIQQTTDGGYILGGYSNSGMSGDKTETIIGYFDYWVIKLDATGQTIEWQNTIGGSSNDFLNSIQQTIDGGYILGGYSESGADGDKNENSQGNKDYWAIKLDSDPAFVTIESDGNEGMLPNQFIILPAYPNPFNPITTITYGIDTDSRITVKIYDITGQLITTLINTEQTQGWHSVVWNGTNQYNKQVPAGIYLSKITSNNTSKTTKLMLLK
jgi:hypothetical protein